VIPVAGVGANGATAITPKASPGTTATLGIFIRAYSLP